MSTASKATHFLGLLAQISIRVTHDRRRRTRGESDHADGREQALVGLLFVGVFVVPATRSLTPCLDRAHYRVPQAAVLRHGGLGVVFLTLALLLFWRSHADLGRQWPPMLQLREGHTLVTRGVYRRARQPMYASRWLRSVVHAMLLQTGSPARPALRRCCPCTRRGRRARSA